MTELRIVADDVVELDGVPVARLLPKLGPTLVYRLTEAFEVLDEAEEDIAQLEDRIAQLEARLGPERSKP